MAYSLDRATLEAVGHSFHNGVLTLMYHDAKGGTAQLRIPLDKFDKFGKHAHFFTRSSVGDRSLVVWNSPSGNILYRTPPFDAETENKAVREAQRYVANMVRVAREVEPLDFGTDDQVFRKTISPDLEKAVIDAGIILARF